MLEFSCKLNRVSSLSTGPAHAVYFATYEAVKQAMGGNEGHGTDHHPLAAGTYNFSPCANGMLMTTPKATSGACATIASDALMNPFDGMPDTALLCRFY